jgi:predicted AAA+ superfamily ATPase
MVKFLPHSYKGIKMFKRNIRALVQKALQRSPVTLLLGARQTGKTTLVKELAQEHNYYYVSLDDIRFYASAQADPMGFIAELPKPLVIDEVQRVPELFLAIKHDVDMHRVPGRYFLTGSANPLLIPKVGDSLAGRVEILTIYPLSQGELHNHTERFIDTLWDAPSFNNFPVASLSRQELYEKIIIGGYPPVQGLSAQDRYVWFNDYITTITQKDIIDLSAIEAIGAMPRLLSILAMHAGSLLNVAEISRQSGIANATLNRYLILLKMIFLIFVQEPWHSNIIRRIMKSPKLYMVDTGLLAWLQLAPVEKIYEQPHLIGPLLENFVMTELQKQQSWNSTMVRLYHFRTSDGNEVDIVLERFDGKIVAIEVKATATPTLKDAQGLLYLKEHVGKAWHRGILLYTGDQVVPLGNGIIALPLTLLWTL